MDKYIEIKTLIDEYIVLMDELIAFEHMKLQAVQSQDNEQLDAFLKDEQVYLLKLRGLDQKREAVQRKLGVENLTYRQIISKTEGQERGELEDSYKLLSTKTIEFKSIVGTIKTYIDLRLHTIDALVEKFGGTSPHQNQMGIYDKITGQPLGEMPPEYSGKFQSTKV